jgi:uncharacterized membrane protein
VEILAFVTIWFFGFGILSAFLAGRRRRDALAWFVIGGFTGPVGAGAVAVLPTVMDSEAGHPVLRRLRHPAALLAALDLVGLSVASYLSFVELQGQLPYCGPLHGCEQVASSEYARIGGVPVAVGGVVLSLVLLSLAVAWWRTGSVALLGAHYALSLAGVVFEGYFTYVELFLIHSVCIWCATYGISLVARFLVALWVWLHRERYAVAR